MRKKLKPIRVRLSNEEMHDDPRGEEYGVIRIVRPARGMMFAHHTREGYTIWFKTDKDLLLWKSAMCLGLPLGGGLITK